jgi:hypothetical protein
MILDTPRSPMLLDTPRRPAPPARRSVSVSQASAPGADTDDDDELHAPAPRARREPSPLSALQLDTFPASTSASASTSATTRAPARRRARGAAGPTVERLNSSLADELVRATDLDSGVLIGVGRSARRGFLAHGGAGGPAVFMGAGYVRGGGDADDHEGGGGGDAQRVVVHEQHGALAIKRSRLRADHR